MNTQIEPLTEEITIRRLAENEIGEALALAWNVFSQYESPAYPPEGTEEFRKCLQDDNYLAGIEYFGAFLCEKLVGEIGIRRETHHICFFFVSGKYHRRGIGKKLFGYLTSVYPGQTITLNSSPYGLPFYRALGFTASDSEQTVNGIRFTPMILKGKNREFRIVKLAERRDLKEKAAAWYSEKWNVPPDAYLESIEASFTSAVPSWYLCLDGEKIVAGMGVIGNDFHDRPDLTPNVCAVYTEEEYRCRGIAGKLLDHVCRDMASHGIGTLYLLTDCTGFYERYGWEFFCTARGNGEAEPSRMYIHRCGGEAPCKE